MAIGFFWATALYALGVLNPVPGVLRGWFLAEEVGLTKVKSPMAWHTASVYWSDWSSPGFAAVFPV